MNFLDVDFPEVTEAYRGSLEDWLELFERYAFPRTGDTETTVEMKRIFKRYPEVTYEDWLDIVIKCVRDELWYEEKINLSIRELYLVVNKVARIDEKLRKIYTNLSSSNNLLEQQYLQEALSYIETLRRAYDKGKLANQLTINAVRRQYSGTHSFLTSQKFDPYFSYLTGIFKLNGNSRYRPVEELAKKKNLNRMLDQTLDAHHILFRSLGGKEDDINNLIALFRYEHIEAHRLFVACLEDYLEGSNAESELNVILAKAKKGLKRLSGDKQDRVSADVLIDLLADDLETDQEELIRRINVNNLMNHLPVYGQTTKVVSDNLQSKDKAQYKVKFIEDIPDYIKSNDYLLGIDPNDPKCAIVYGVEGVQKIIYDITGEKISENSVNNRTTSKEKPVARNKRGNEIPAASFTMFGLQPNGIYRDTGDGTRHESKPIIYFKINNETLTPEYDSGQWVQSINALKDSGIGVPYKAYQRLDQTHNDLVKGFELSRVFKGNIDSETQQSRDFYVFMYADDIDLLQNVINKKNKNSKTQQINIKVVDKDGKTWYPNSEQRF